MSDKKISQLPIGNIIPDTIFPIVTSGVTSQTSFSNIADALEPYFSGGSDSTSPITIVGTSSLFSTALNAGTGSSPSNSVFIGVDTGQNATNAFNSNFIGINAGTSATSSSFSNFIGQNAGFEAINATQSNFIGLGAGYGASDASNSNFIGNQAGYQASEASNSNFFGEQAGYGASNGFNSNFLGNNAGFDATNAYSSNFFGYQAGYEATDSYFSTFIGTQAGYQASDASLSTLIGFYAGKAFAGNNVGSNNIIIGTNISLPNGASNRMNLGGVLFGFNTHSNIGSTPSITNTPNGRVAINKSDDNGVDTLQIGGTLNIGNVPIHENNTEASGLPVGSVYRTSTGVLMIRF